MIKTFGVVDGNEGRIVRETASCEQLHTILEVFPTQKLVTARIDKARPKVDILWLCRTLKLQKRVELHKLYPANARHLLVLSLDADRL